MKRIRAYFHSKTPEQILSLCLLIVTSFTMLLCVIARLSGCLWFAADLTSVKEPSRFWQEVISSALLIFELVFVYKILCRTSWKVCCLLSIAETIVCLFIGFITNGNQTISNIFTLVCYFAIPFAFNRSFRPIVESAILYLLEIAYSALFLVGRIGGIEIGAAYNFIYGVLGSIDYKLFIVSIYLVVKNFGGIRLWKKQRKSIFQTGQRT